MSRKCWIRIWFYCGCWWLWGLLFLG